MNRLTAFLHLSPSEVAELAGHFGLSNITKCVALDIGIINTNYRFESGGQIYLLRLYPPERQKSALHFELSTLSRLAQADFPSPRALPGRHDYGGDYSEKYGRYFAIFHYIRGEMLRREDIDLTIVREIGQLFARMQNLLDGFVPAGEKPSADLEYIAGLFAEVEPRLRALPGQGARVADELHTIWHSSVAHLTSRHLAKGFVHADLYFANVVVDGGHVKGILDFDDSYFGLLVVDLAVVLMEFAFVAADTFNFEYGRALIESYLNARPRAVQELAVLHESMVCACYKYLGYTSNLDAYAGEKLLENEYISRIRYLASPAVSDEILALIHDLQRRYA